MRDPTPGSCLALRIEHTPHAFRAIEQELATVVAEQTALLLHDQDPTTTAHEFDDRIRDALASRELIAQGQGVLMERLGVNARDAYLTLRRDAVEIATSLRGQAAYLVAETQNRPGAPEEDGPPDE